MSESKVAKNKRRRKRAKKPQMCRKCKTILSMYNTHPYLCFRCQVKEFWHNVQKQFEE